MQQLKIKRAIISLTDKSFSAELGTFLQSQGVEIVSTGGTLKELEKSDVRVTPVNQVTDFPEIMGGRVKTLHPAIHAGILADKDNPEHIETISRMAIEPFDLVCVNLYNFKRAVQEDMDLHQAIEQIDIGGPTLLRAAAKNLNSVCVLPSPEFYTEFIQEVKNNGAIGLDFRRKTAAYTFKTTSEYDRMIAEFLARNM
mgnify:CR=1 FL=1